MGSLVPPGPVTPPLPPGLGMEDLGVVTLVGVVFLEGVGASPPASDEAIEALEAGRERFPLAGSPSSRSNCV